MQPRSDIGIHGSYSSFSATGRHDYKLNSCLASSKRSRSSTLWYNRTPPTEAVGFRLHKNRGFYVVNTPSPAASYFTELASLLGRLTFADFGPVVQHLMAVLSRGATVAFAGNGGSAATAEHIAADIARCALQANTQGRAISLGSNVSSITQIANDQSYNQIYQEHVYRLLRQGDALVVISVSGTSANLIAAAHAATAIGASVVAILGVPGELEAMSDASFVVGSNDYGLAEDTHLAFGHLLTRAILGSRNLIEPTRPGH